MKSILNSVFLVLSLGALAAPKYPTAVFERPFTMPENSFETGLRFTNDNIAELDVNYGITHNFELGLGWGGLDAGNLPAQKVALNAAHFLFTTPYASSMARFSIPFHFNRMVLQEATLDMPTYVPIIRGKLNLVFLEDLVKLVWLDDTSADFKFSTRLSWQVTHFLCLSLITSPGTLSTSGGHTHLISATPVSIKALYAITPMVDVVGSLGFENIQNAGGFSAMLGMAFRGGDIEG